MYSAQERPHTGICPVLKGREHCLVVLQPLICYNYIYVSGLNEKKAESNPSNYGDVLPRLSFDRRHVYIMTEMSDILVEHGRRYGRTCLVELLYHVIYQYIRHMKYNKLYVGILHIKWPAIQNMFEKNVQCFQIINLLQEDFKCIGNL